MHIDYTSLVTYEKLISTLKNPQPQQQLCLPLLNVKKAQPPNKHISGCFFFFFLLRRCVARLGI